MGVQGSLLGVAIILITYAEDSFVIGIHAFFSLNCHTGFYHSFYLNLLLYSASKK